MVPVHEKSDAFLMCFRSHFTSHASASIAQTETGQLRRQAVHSPVILRGCLANNEFQLLSKLRVHLTEIPLANVQSMSQFSEMLDSPKLPPDIDSIIGSKHSA